MKILSKLVGISIAVTVGISVISYAVAENVELSVENDTKTISTDYSTVVNCIDTISVNYDPSGEELKEKEKEKKKEKELEKEMHKKNSEEKTAKKKNFIKSKYVLDGTPYSEMEIIVGDNQDEFEVLESIANEDLKVNELTNEIVDESGNTLIYCGIVCENSLSNEENLSMLNEVTKQKIEKEYKDKKAKYKLDGIKIIGKTKNIDKYERKELDNSDK